MQNSSSLKLAQEKVDPAHMRWVRTDLRLAGMKLEYSPRCGDALTKDDFLRAFRVLRGS